MAELFPNVYTEVRNELNSNFFADIDLTEVPRRCRVRSYLVVNEMRTGIFSSVFYKNENGQTCYSSLAGLDDPTFVIAGYLTTVESSNEVPSDYYKKNVIKIEIYNAIIRNIARLRFTVENNRNNYIDQSEYDLKMRNLQMQTEIIEACISNLLNNVI